MPHTATHMVRSEQMFRVSDTYQISQLGEETKIKTNHWEWRSKGLLTHHNAV